MLKLYPNSIRKFNFEFDFIVLFWKRLLDLRWESSSERGCSGNRPFCHGLFADSDLLPWSGRRLCLGSCILRFLNVLVWTWIFQNVSAIIPSMIFFVVNKKMLAHRFALRHVYHRHLAPNAFERLQTRHVRSRGYRVLFSQSRQHWFSTWNCLWL